MLDIESAPGEGVDIDIESNPDVGLAENVNTSFSWKTLSPDRASRPEVRREAINGAGSSGICMVVMRSPLDGKLP